MSTGAHSHSAGLDEDGEAIEGAIVQVDDRMCEGRGNGRPPGVDDKVHALQVLPQRRAINVFCEDV